MNEEKLGNFGNFRFKSSYDSDYVHIQVEIDMLFDEICSRIESLGNDGYDVKSKKEDNWGILYKVLVLYAGLYNVKVFKRDMDDYRHLSRNEPPFQVQIWPLRTGEDLSSIDAIIGAIKAD